MNIVLQLAYKTETLKKNNFNKEKIHLLKNTKSLKTKKKPQDVVVTVSEKYKKYLYKNPKNLGVCN